jgi:3-deoxy-7-phosphoheptulonate synthase
MISSGAFFLPFTLGELIMEETQDLNVCQTVPLIPPRALWRALPMNPAANRTVEQGRRAIRHILAKKDQRLLAIVGPCSIHDPEATLEYARRLHALCVELQDRLCIVMRVYFEKPRTTVGWKGLIYDPLLDGSEDLPTGLNLARRLLLQINELGVPAATEMLDPITPQYNADLISWAAIGARTTESQTHREMASGLSMPVGFKNSTAGNLEVAINAMEAARGRHTFLGIDAEGHTAMIRTQGNPWGHMVLRGGNAQPNYDAENISIACRRLRQAGVEPALVVDCSHDNSGKKHERQESVWNNVLEQRQAGNSALDGVGLDQAVHFGL